MLPSRRDALALGALFTVALTLRLLFLPDYDEDLDALRFRLAVERFDPAEGRPHAPFYPVYIAGAKLAASLGAPSLTALGAISALSGAALLIFIALLTHEILGRRAAYLAGALSLASPFLWLASVKIGSDTAGAATIAAALWLFARARRLPERAPFLRTAAILILGISLGVRLSYFPFVIACTFLAARAESGSPRALAERARDLFAGTALWLVPLVIVARPRPLVEAAIKQGLGHFGRWGGSAITVSSPAARLYGVVWGLWSNVLGGAWVDATGSRWITAPLLALLLALGLRRALPLRDAIRRQPELSIGMIAYFGWALLGQNTAFKPRHWLPLAPLLIFGLVAGAERLLDQRRTAIAAPLIIAAQWLTEGASLVSAHRDPSPVASAARFLAEGRGRDERAVIAGDAARLYLEGAPGRRVVPVHDGAALLGAVIAEGERGALISSEALTPTTAGDLRAQGYELSVIWSRPRSRYVDSLWNELALLEARRTAHK